MKPKLNTSRGRFSMSRKGIDKNIEWWQLLIWENMRITWRMLPTEIQMKIRDMGKAPSWDKEKTTQDRNQT